ncbi:hypothetical protein ACFSKU_17875 [Pontibacter silvestris]|uniref:SMP-30/Gluconolactonase/LRE-like region domain-containing protein n=1 Tax=Pontibacter silvestris TaxID=2305183 RepID=A0ABW4X1C8_9BACT|nr:hypothetical protein [Pontibacter silvestris]MCC9135895.1 hypothetical protein [Pontibacter silvestris]
MNIDHSGDLLYMKSVSQPTTGVNSFTCVLSRYNTTTNQEVATVTLLNVPGYDYGTHIVFTPGKNGIVCDEAGNLYVTVYNSNKVYRFDGPIPTSGNVTKEISYTYTVPGSGSETVLALDLIGNLFIGRGTGVFKIPVANLTTNTEPSLVFNASSITINDIDFKDGSVYLASGGTKLAKYSAKGVLRKLLSLAR